MSVAEDYLAETSQRHLAAGVLKQVAQDLRRFHGRTSAVERELYRDAYSWLISNDQAWPFSFLNVCRLLSLAPESVRETLLGDSAVGLFSYWSRRWRRAVRKLQIFLGDAFTRNRRPTVVDPVPLAHAIQ